MIGFLLGALSGVFLLGVSVGVCICVKVNKINKVTISQFIPIVSVSRESIESYENYDEIVRNESERLV